MFKQSAYINTQVDQYKIRIHADLIERFSDVLLELKGNEANGMPIATLGTLGAYEKVTDLLGINPQNLLHSRETIKVISSPQVGDEIEVITFISDLYEQQASGNPMGFAVIEVVGKKGGSIVFAVNRIYAIRGGFPRR